MTAPPADRLEAIRLAAQAELARTPVARPWWVGAALLAGLNTATGVGLALLMSTNDAQHGSQALRWLGAAGLLVISVAGAVAAVRPGWRWARRGLGAITAGTVLALLFGASGIGPAGGAACGALEVAATLLPLIGSLAVLSSFAPDALRTLVGGLAAGAGGVFALHLHCPNGALAHLVIFHLGPWLLVTAVALGLRRRVRSSTFAP